MSLAEDALGDLGDRLPASIGATGAASEALADILARLAGATQDASGRLRDASGRFISAGDQAKAAASGFTGAGEALAKTTEAAKGAGGALPAVTGGATAASKGLESLAGSANQSLQALVPHNAALDAAVSALKAMGPEGEAAAIALQIVVTVATFAAQALWDLAAAAVSISQEKDALAATFEALGPAGADGRELVDQLSEVAAKLPFAEGKVLAWGKAFMAAGIQGAALEQAVNAVAAATAIMGESGGAAAETLIKRFQMAAATGQEVKLDRRILTQLAAAGVSATALAKALGVPADQLGKMSVGADKLGEAFQKALIEKGAKSLEALGLSLSVVSAKFHDGVEDLFEDAGKFVQPFMAEVKSLFAEFAAGSAAQSIVKSVLMAFFQDLFYVATRALNAIHVGLLYVELGFLYAALAIQPVVEWIRKLLQNATFLEGVKLVLFGIAIVLGIVAAAVALAALGFLVFVAVIGAFVGAIVYAAAFVIGAVADLASSIKGALSVDLTATGGSIIDSLVGGITSKIGAVVGAMGSVGNAILGALPKSLVMHSPSVPLTKQAKQIAGSIVDPLEDAAPDADKAMAKLGGGKPDFAKPGVGGKGGGKSFTFNISNCTFGGGTTKEKIRLWMSEVAEEEGDAEPSPAPA